jgi:DNA repair exonuclease SbcCD ATPase subunit
LLEGADLDPAAAVDVLTKAARFKQVSILKRKVADANSLKRARDLYKELFHQLGRDEEDSLVADFRARLGAWQTELHAFKLTASTPYHPGKADINTALTRIAQQLAIRDSFAFIEAFLNAKDEWLDAADDISDLVNFYQTQIVAWRKLLDGLQTVADNRAALDKLPQAASALTELAQIRDNAKPYGMVSRIEPLLATVISANEQLAQEKRDRALLSVDEKLTEVQAKLSAVGASPDLSNKALRQLQDLKARIANQTSIAQILYLQGQGGEAMDDAITLIEAAVAVKPPPVAKPANSTKPTQTGPADVPQAPAKTTKVVRAAELSTKSYLETEADVHAYIEKLKTELINTVRAGQIARIQ